MTIIQAVKYGVILLVIGSIVFAIHDNGRKIERGVWLQEQSDYQQALAKELGEAMQRKADLERENLKSIAKAINEKDSSIAKLEHDINATRRLYVAAENKKCSPRDLSRKAESTGQSGGKAVRVELSEQDAENIRRDYTDAQRVVIQYEACRAALLPLVEVIQ